MERRVTATLRGDPGSSGVVIGPLRQASVFLIISTVFAEDWSILRDDIESGLPFNIFKFDISDLLDRVQDCQRRFDNFGPIPSPANTAIL